MTTVEMHAAFNLELKAQGRHEDFEPEEVDVFLNRAVRAFVDERKPLVRTDEGALADLRTLIESRVYFIPDISSHAVYYDVQVIKLEPEAEYPVAGRVHIAGSRRRPLQFFSYTSFIDRLMADDHTPAFRRQPATVEGDQLLIFSAIDEGIDPNEIDRVDFTFLRPPARITYTGSPSELPPHTHPHIVTSAVDLARQALFATE